MPTGLATTPAPVDAVPIPPRFKWLKRFVKLGVALLVGLFVLRLWWGHVAHSRLQAEIDRIRAAGEPIFPEDFDPPPLPKEQNGVPLLIEAMESLSPNLTTEQTKLLEGTPPCEEWKPEHLEMAAQIVEANAQTLSLVRQARSRAGVDWGLRIRSPAINLLLPLAADRQLARLLKLTALHHHHAGRDDETAETLLDALDQAQKVGMKPLLIGYLVATAIDGLTCSTIERVAPDLAVCERLIPYVDRDGCSHRSQVEEVITVLLDESAIRKALVRAMQCERMFQLDVIRGCCEGFASLISISRFGGATGPSTAERVSIFPFAPLFELDGVQMVNHMSRVAEAIEKPTWPEANVIMAPLELEAESVRVDFNRLRRPVSAVMLPSLSRAVLVHYRGIAHRRMAAIALAIRLYEVDHGRRPRELSELVPQYLAAVPIDPIANDGRPITYAQLADGAILYSLGDNGLDDGGLERVGPNRKPREDWDLVFHLDPKPPSVPQTADGQGDVADDQRDSKEDQAAEGQPVPKQHEEE